MEIIHTPVLLQETLKYLSPVGEPFEKNCFMVAKYLFEHFLPPLYDAKVKRHGHT